MEMNDYEKQIARRVWFPIMAICIALAVFSLAGCSTWNACADPYADYPGCGDREG